jgi:hypothetical protein
MRGLLKTTASQWTALVAIVLVSAVMMYFTFTPYSFFGLQEPFAPYEQNEPFAGMPPTVPIKTFRPAEKARRAVTYNFGNPR